LRRPPGRPLVSTFARCASGVSGAAKRPGPGRSSAAASGARSLPEKALS